MEDEIKTNEGGIPMGTPPSTPIPPSPTPPIPDLSTGEVPATNINDLLGTQPSGTPKPVAEPSNSFYYNPAATPAAPVSSPVTESATTPSSSFSKRMESASYSSGGGGGKKKILIAIVAVVVLALVGFGGYFLYSKTLKTYPVTINVNPIDANISVGSKSAAAKDGKLTLKLKKGNYDVSVSKDGYISVKKTLTVKGTANESMTVELSQFLTFSPTISKGIKNPVYNKETESLIYLEKGEQWTSIKEYSLKELTQEEIDEITADAQTPEEKQQLLEKSKTTVLIDGLPDIKKITWSKTYRQAAVRIVNSAANEGSKLPFQKQYGEGALMYWILDLDRKDLVNANVKSLHPSLKNISFSPDGNKIAYYYNGGSKRSIAVANLDGTDYAPIINIESIKFDPDVIWSNDGVKVAIFVNRSDGDQSNAGLTDVYVYNFEARGTSKISLDDTPTAGVSYDALFSPDSSKILFNYGPKLAIYDFEKEGTAAILETGAEAKVSNCTWVSEDTVITITDNKELLKIKTIGTKDTVEMNKEGLPGIITGILSDTSNIYLIGDTGVFQAPLEKII